jgi:hypothetical protein
MRTFNRRSAEPPQTSNREAITLIADAQRHCGGCRSWWRLKGWRRGCNPTMYPPDTLYVLIPVQAAHQNGMLPPAVTE